MDVSIVGGGFAGVVTGLKLLSTPGLDGLEVTIHERNGSIGTTLCGEGLSAVTLGRMRYPGFDHAPFVGRSFSGAAWSLPSGKRLVVPDSCHTMDRRRWIPAMAERFEAMGGTLRLGSKLTVGDVRHLPGDLMIGADGPGSMVRRAIGGKVDTRLGIQYRVTDPNIETDALLFHTDKRFSREYSWVFPRGDDAEWGHVHNVGLLANEDGLDWERLDRYMAWQKVGGRVVKREAYPIAFNGTVFERGRHVLIGDAAGMTNPVTKGGMSAVVYASEVLADRLVRHGAGGGRAGKGGIGYEQALRSHPVLDPSFSKAVEIIKRTSNEQVDRWARFLPQEIVLGQRGRSLRRSLVAKSVLGNLGGIPDFWVIYRAMGLARVYSW